jgi:hypothetical protein
MNEKTYTLTEVINNLRDAQDSGLLAKLGIHESSAAGTVAIALGYDITSEGFQQFDADLTAAGL